MARPARRRERDEAGMAGSVWFLLLIAGTFVILLGLVVDGGQVLDDRADASRVAAQAARRGADELSQASVRDGGDAVSSQRAQTAAQTFVAAAGLRGSATVDGDQVTVTITGSTRTRFLAAIGITSLPVDETRTATGIENPNDQPDTQGGN